MMVADAVAPVSPGHKYPWCDMDRLSCQKMNHNNLLCNIKAKAYIYVYQKSCTLKGKPLACEPIGHRGAWGLIQYKDGILPV